MTAEPASMKDSIACWLPGGVLVVLQNGAPEATPHPGMREFLFDRDQGQRKISLVCAHDPAARAGIDSTFDGHICDWQTFIRENFAALDGETRAGITNFLASALDQDCCRRAGARRLAAGLHAAREGLRERAPMATASSHQPLALNVDVLVATGERSCYVRGWCYDDDAPGGRLIAVSPEGARIELTGLITRFERPEITALHGGKCGERPGFLGHFELPAESLLHENWVFEWHSESGESIEAAAPARVTEPVAGRDLILGDIALESPRQDEFLSHHIHPAVSALQQRRHSAIQLARVDQYGTAPARAESTVIIPLYQRTDFLEHQLAQFVNDAEFREATDLIYVLDSPEQADELAARAARLARLYRVPFRIATLNQNGGYSAANNIGATLARGRLLVLLNSDVLPDRPGWLRAMAQFHRATPGIGALGPKLLFEDDTIQHAGLYFSPMPEGADWENQHFFKGMHRSHAAADVTRVVPAVTGACLLIERALYEKVGGLQGSYVQGDYEDSDLCLRLAEAGLQNWYLPSVELYHLEGQSYPAPLRALTSRYNRWLHTRTWRPQIAATMQACDRFPVPCP